MASSDTSEKAIVKLKSTETNITNVYLTQPEQDSLKVYIS